MTGQVRGVAVHDAVLGRTLELLGARGWDFAVEDVAAAAGVNKTTVYRRWPTKGALVAAALQQMADATVGVEKTDDVRHDLQTLAAQVADALRRPAGVNALRAAFSTAGTEPGLAEASAAFLSARYQDAVDLIVAAQHRGQLRPDVPAVDIWKAIANPMHVEAVLTGTVAPSTPATLVELVLDGAVARTDER